MSIVATDPLTHSRVRPDLARSAHPAAVEIAAERMARHAPKLPMGALLLLLLPTFVDVFSVVQHEAAFHGVSLAVGTLAAFVLILLLRRDHHAALAIGVVAFVGSLGLRVLESPFGPMVTLAGLLVLGVGGAFASTSPTACDLLDGDVSMS
jgi:dolichol kinase